MNIKVVNQTKDISRVIINDAKTYNKELEVLKEDRLLICFLYLLKILTKYPFLFNS